MIRKQVLQKLGIGSLFLLVFLAGLIFSPMIGRLAFPKTIGRLNVSIYPKNCTLYKGETETFIALVLNGSGKYEYEWAVNGSIASHEARFQFGFEQVCKIVVLSVFVRDSEGNWGYSTEIVYDPIALAEAGAYSLDVPIPVASYYIGEFTNGSDFAVNGSNWECFKTSTNATEVFEDCMNPLFNGIGGKVLIASGTYDIGDDVIEFKDGNGVGSVSLIGETRPSKEAVVITGNGTYMITTNTTSWVQGGNGAYHTLENLCFRHNTPNDDAITINLPAIIPNTRNLWISNINATRQGTGIKVFTTTPQGNTGYPHTWENVECSNYGTAFYIDVDHVTFQNLIAYNPKDYAFLITNCAWDSFQNLQILPSTSPTDCFMLYFNDTQQGMTVFGVAIEGSGTTFNNPIITAANTPKQILIDGFYMQGTLDEGNQFWNRTDGGSTAEYFIHINAHSGNFLSEYSGTNIVVANNEWIAHGLLNEPFFVDVTQREMTYDDVSVIVGVVNRNATYFQVGVYWTNGTAVTDDVLNIDWYASVNRR